MPEIRGTVHVDRINLKPMTQAQRDSLPDQKEGDVVLVTDGQGTKISSHDGASFTEPAPSGQEFSASQASRNINGGNF